ncbi:DNA invertase Pin-like site-specific DNA recombinase [Bradyrhizobium diazoefficiens]
MKSELVTPSHLARKAVVYIRQSTPHQVVSNQESLRLQYALRQRARELGWREAAIDVIDADLGLSGASIAQRNGFKELVGRVGLSEVGLILSIDVTRLARNCTDWYPLLDICGLRGCLIADRDGVYDPGTPNGRLLLGLKGSISELELHTIRSRLTAGLLAKAERGELAVMLPIGLMRDPSGVVVKDPDMAVQGRLGLVFQLFLQLRSVAKVMRALNERDLELPRRDRYGDLCWTRATLAAVADRLPQIWGDETISDAHRKALLRCLIEKVVLDRGERDLALARIVWRGGAVTELEVKMSVNSVTRLTRGTEMRERLLTLARDGVPDDKIATILTREGHRSPRCADKVLPITVGRLRRAAAIKVTAQRSRWEHDDSYLSPPELARRLEIPVNWLYVQIRTKRLLIDRQPSGAYLFPNTPSVLHAIGDLRNHVIAQLDLRICQPNKEGQCMTPSLICGHSKRPSRPRRL